MSRKVRGGPASPAPRVQGEDDIDPRATRSREAVLGAARRLLSAEGRDSINPMRLATESGVGRATIYRHWPDPSRILLDAVTSAPPTVPPPATGDLETDLLARLESLRTGLTSTPLAPLFATLIERAEYDLDLQQLQRDFADRASAGLRAILDDAIARAELAPGDTDSMVETLAAPLFYRRFISRRPIPADYPARLVHNFLDHS